MREERRERKFKGAGFASFCSVNHRALELLARVSMEMNISRQPREDRNFANVAREDESPSEAFADTSTLFATFRFFDVRSLRSAVDEWNGGVARDVSMGKGFRRRFRSFRKVYKGVGLMVILIDEWIYGQFVCLSGSF